MLLTDVKIVTYLGCGSFTIETLQCEKLAKNKNSVMLNFLAVEWGTFMEKLKQLIQFESYIYSAYLKLRELRKEIETEAAQKREKRKIFKVIDGEKKD